MHHLTAAGRRIAAFYWVGLDWQGLAERRDTRAGLLAFRLAL